ncbi:hypothetical protein BaRGS_00004973, partial [Batillaria attramentaria]
MSGFNQDDGFFQAGYYDNQSQGQGQQYSEYSGYDYEGAQQFGQEPQFGQFDYSQQQGSYVPDPGYGGGQYAGSIMTPSMQYTGPSDTQGVENYEDEPPLMEELGINFDHITQK